MGSCLGCNCLEEKDGSTLEAYDHYFRVDNQKKHPARYAVTHTKNQGDASFFH